MIKLTSNLTPVQVEAIAKITAAKNSIAYKVCVDAISARGIKMHPNYKTGSGSSSGVTNHMPAIVLHLRSAGIKFETGNDAARGGRIGDWVMVTL